MKWKWPTQKDEQNHTYKKQRNQSNTVAYKTTHDKSDGQAKKQQQQQQD